ncbi:MAG: hypothetical protein JWP36_746, partial [Paucimonas sp.]|nr:hypothetical protein [Paucimonas sp.]
GEASNAKPMVDDLVIVEVMVQELDTAWWHTLRASLESQFRQQDIVIRAHAVTLL